MGIWGCRRISGGIVSEASSGYLEVQEVSGGAGYSKEIYCSFRPLMVPATGTC